jgi:HEAT repeat protein
MTALFLAIPLLLAPRQGELADEKSADAAVEAFKTAFKAPSEADRIEAVKTLAATVHAKTLSKLASVLNSGEGPKVRGAAAKGISQFAALKKQAAAALTSGLSVAAKDNRMLVTILEALGALGEPSSLPTVHRMFDEKESTVARAAIAAAAEIKNAQSVDPLIATLVKFEKLQKSNSGGAMQKELPAGGVSVNTAQSADFMKNLQDTIDATNKALSGITGQDMITKSADWQAWWNRNRASFKP